MPEPVDASVLERFRQGDQEAVGPLLERLRPYIRVIVRSACGDRPAAGVDESDLIQNVMLQAVRANGTFRGNSLGEFARWLRTIAVRSSQQAFLRAAGCEPALPGRDLARDVAHELANAVSRDESYRPEAALAGQENAALMAAALSRLPEDMRQVLLLRLVDGLSHGQIAERLDRTPGAVRMLFLRSVERLREECGTRENWL
jgi:RNA polymerase sigma-70 factor (ECF subfamily)